MTELKHFLTEAERHQAMSLAKEAMRWMLGLTAPNPSVGAVIWKEGACLAQAAHAGPGHPHAEVAVCDGLADDDIRGSDLMVTLEPCCHTGRTPPCTEWILAKGFRSVTFSQLDPNPRVAGQGMAWLLSHGIPCYHVPDPEIEEAYAPYVSFWQCRRSEWVLKLACDARGVMATASKQPWPLSDPHLSGFTQMWRKHTDAILTTTTTLAHDQSRMTVRWGEQTLNRPLCIVGQPRRLWAKPPPAVQLASACHWFGPVDQLSGEDRIQMRSWHLHHLPELKRPEDWDQLRQKMAAVGFHRIWVECGPRFAGAALAGEAVSRCFIYVNMEDVGVGQGYGLASVPQFNVPMSGRWEYTMRPITMKQWLIDVRRNSFCLQD